jgi:hypothetical protein
MLHKNTSNVFSSAAPLYYYLKLLGLFPASFFGDIKDGKFKNKLSDKIQVALIGGIWFITLTYGIFRTIEVKESHDLSVLVLRMWTSSIYIGNFSILLAIIYQFWYFDKILTIFASLNDFDSKVS